VEKLMSATFSHNGQTHTVTILARRPHLVLSVDGRRHVVQDVAGHAGGTLAIDGEAVTFAHARTDAAVAVRLGGATHRMVWQDPRAAAAGHTAADDVIRAPMPGAVIAVHHAAGDTVAEGAVIVTIESMKLQTALIAPRAGVIAEISVGDGDRFDKDAVIVRLAPPDKDPAP
jgi:acetyl/propionyl-CoA carboxylase alpha subunit